MSVHDLPAMDSSFDSPQRVMGCLAEIERDMAVRQNGFEAAASGWFRAQPEIKRAYATALLTSRADSVTEKKAEADLAALSCPGTEHEAEYEATKAVLGLLEKRSMVLMSILKGQGRA